MNSRSGKHLNPVRRVSGLPAEEFEEQRKHAESLGMSWAEWIRTVAAEAMRRENRRRPSK